MIGLAPELLRSAQRGHALNASAAVQKTASTPAIQLALADAELTAPDNVASFPLSLLPPWLDAVVTLSIRAGPLLVVKTRRLVRVPIDPGQHAVVVPPHDSGPQKLFLGRKTSSLHESAVRNIYCAPDNILGRPNRKGRLSSTITHAASPSSSPAPVTPTAT